MVNNPDGFGLLLNSNVGVNHFCKECEQFDFCSHDLQKIFNSTYCVIDYYNQKLHPVHRDLKKNPVWYERLYKEMCSVMNEIQREKADAN